MQHARSRHSGRVLTGAFNRSRVIVFFLFVGFARLWASGEIPVNLPTTVYSYDERGDIRAIGGRCLLVARGDDTYRSLPFDTVVQFENNNYALGQIKLSVDGKHVFASGAGGLYRCDIQSGLWKSIQPPSARPSSSPAIAVGPDGVLYAGFGQSFWTLSYTGLFKSTDNGDNWSEMNLVFDSATVSPSVNDLVVSASGRIFIFGQPDRGTGQYIYEILQDGTMLKVGFGSMLIHNDRVSSYSQRVVRFGTRPGDSTAQKLYFATDDVTIMGATAWPDDDTLALLVQKEGRFAMIRMVDGVIVGTRDLCASVGRFVPWITASSAGGRKSIIFSGLGVNLRIYLDTDETVPLNFPVEYPRVFDVLCTRSWGIAWVDRHGWFRFDNTGRVRYDSAVSRRFSSGIPLDSKLSGRMIFSEYGRRIIEISEASVDTIFTLHNSQYSGSVNLVDVNKGGDVIHWVNDQRILRTDLKTRETDTLSLDGWPVAENGTVRTPLSPSGVWVFGTRILAWAAFTTTEAEGQEGLYEYTGARWKFVRGSTDGDRTSMVVSARNDSTIIFAVAQSLGSFGYSTPSIVMMRYADSAASICPGGDVFTSDITSLTTLQDRGLITTESDRVYRMSSDSAPIEIDLRTNVLKVCEMDEFVVVASFMRSLFLLPKREMVTSVPDERLAAHYTASAEAYPNPVEQGKPLAIRLPQCCAQPVITIVDLLGRSFQSTRCDVGALVGGDARIETSDLTPGHYLLRLSGPTCTHVVPIRVTR